jgi:sterol desaturase/sphingolipid hydroxylase (fatty acid hydroxylase superfamily)
MITLQSIKWFVLINTLLISGGTLEYNIHAYFENNMFVLLGLTLLKNRGLQFFIDYKTSDKKRLLKEAEDINSLANMYYLVQASVVEGLTLYFLLYMLYLSDSYEGSDYGYTLLTFIPHSFMFDVVFDFFHYWTHRMNHAVPLLYKHFHKEHHAEKYLYTSVTFHHSLGDLLITNTVPFLLTCYIVGVHEYFLFLYVWYKVFGEIGGHLSKDVKASSFAQCMWIPRLLKIELYTHDHTIHHSYPNKNFSKRFSLWDKVFGTYVAGKTILEK